MGAQSFINETVGYSVREAFDELVSTAQREWGTDSYNGTISTCTLGRVTKFASTCTPKVEKDAYNWLRAHYDSFDKWTAKCLDCGIVQWEILTPVKAPIGTPSPAKYKTMYCVQEDTYSPRPIKSFEKKSEATAFAKTNAAKYNGLVITRQPVLISGESLIEAWETKKRVVKKKPAKIPAGATVKELHKYVFYGYAAT